MTSTSEVWADLAAQVDAVLARPKAQAIMDAASRLFLAHGYAATSMDAITREAGVSKATVYEHFGGKDELFRAMVGCACWRHARLVAPDVEGRPLRAWLVELGVRLLDLMLSDEAIGIYRVVAAEAARTPSLGRAFFEAGPMRMRRLIADRLARARDEGEIACGDVERVAVQLIALFRGDFQLRALFALPGPPDRSTLQREVEAAVDLVLRGYAPGTITPAAALH